MPPTNRLPATNCRASTLVMSLGCAPVRWKWRGPRSRPFLIVSGAPVLENETKQPDGPRCGGPRLGCPVLCRDGEFG